MITPAADTPKAKTQGTSLVIRAKGVDGKSTYTAFNYRGMTKGKFPTAFFVSEDNTTGAFASAMLQIGPIKDGSVEAIKDQTQFAKLKNDGGVFFTDNNNYSAEIKGAKADEINGFVRKSTEEFRVNKAAAIAKTKEAAPEAPAKAQAPATAPAAEKPASAPKKRSMAAA